MTHADQLRKHAHALLALADRMDIHSGAGDADPEPMWLSLARAEVGVREIAGIDHNERVLEYHQATGLQATDDETPWCASFVCWCLEEAGVRSPRSAASRDFRAWGVQVQSPRLGDVVVFDHGGGKGHVGFFMGREGDGIDVLGGNQSNEVNISTFGGAKLHSFRRPHVGTR